MADPLPDHLLELDRRSARAGFDWRDGERTIRFGSGLIAGSGDALAELGWPEWQLITTERALADAPDALRRRATRVHLVGPGQIPDLAAGLQPELGPASLVALGGGRVIDVAKALGAVDRLQVAALPTTLSGAELTRIHRLPAGAAPVPTVRPAVVLADPDAMTGLAEPALRASAMNALAHGADALWGPRANPAASAVALRGAALFGVGLGQRVDRPALALASLLCAYALDSAGLGLHHIVCQSLVRITGTPHAETNARLLPLTLAAMARRRPLEAAALAQALGADAGERGLADRIRELAGPVPALGELGGSRERIGEAIAAMRSRGDFRTVPEPPTEAELRGLVETAW